MFGISSLISAGRRQPVAVKAKRRVTGRAMVDALERRQFLTGAADGSILASAYVADSASGMEMPLSHSSTTSTVDRSHINVVTPSAKQSGQFTFGELSSGALTGVYTIGGMNMREVSFTKSGADGGILTAEGNRALTETNAQTFVNRPPKPLPKAAQPPRDFGHKPVKPPSILLVEDDNASRNALATLLKRRGYSVVAVATLAEGIASLSSDPDCIIVDLNLPDGPGENILRQVKLAHLHSRITVLTGVDDDQRLSNVVALGAEHVLHKPVKLPELLHGLAEDSRPN